MRRLLVALLLLCFLTTGVIGPRPAHAQPLLGLPEPGTMLSLSAAYKPAVIKGLTLDANNPFAFNFIVDLGDDKTLSSPNVLVGDPQQERLKVESTKLIKYFLAALTIPEKDLWVNLSPYEKDRLLPDNLAQTEMGRDMLAQDYLLKQLTASLIYPEKELGKAFWDKVYAKAQQLYGSTQVPVNTFNKVWIVADKADVFERGQTAFIVDAHLKVMLEEDYLASHKNGVIASGGAVKQSNAIASRVIKEIILPEIEKEINEGRNFAPLRQMFYSMILATWFKKALKQGLVAQLYADQGKTQVGVNQENPALNEEIYERYLQAYKKGVFNYIKDSNPTDAGVDTTSLPRKYFSGGLSTQISAAMRTVSSFSLSTLQAVRYAAVSAELDQQGMNVEVDINQGIQYAYDQTVQRYGDRFGWNSGNVHHKGSCKYVTQFLLDYLSAQGFKVERVAYSGDTVEDYHYVILLRLKEGIVLIDPTWQQMFSSARSRKKSFPRALVVSVDSLRKTLLGYGVEVAVIDKIYKELIGNYYQHYAATKFFYRKAIAQFNGRGVSGAVGGVQSAAMSVLGGEVLNEIFTFAYSPEQLERFKEDRPDDIKSLFVKPFPIMDITAEVAPYVEQVIKSTGLTPEDFLAQLKADQLSTEIRHRLILPWNRKDAGSGNNNVFAIPEKLFEAYLQELITQKIYFNQPRRLSVVLGGTYTLEVKRVLEIIYQMLEKVAQAQHVGNVEEWINTWDVQLTGYSISGRNIAEIKSSLKERPALMADKWFHLEFMDLLDPFQRERMANRHPDIVLTVVSLYITYPINEDEAGVLRPEHEAYVNGVYDILPENRGLFITEMPMKRDLPVTRFLQVSPPVTSRKRSGFHLKADNVHYFHTLLGGKENSLEEHLLYASFEDYTAGDFKGAAYKLLTGFYKMIKVSDEGVSQRFSVDTTRMILTGFLKAHADDKYAPVADKLLSLLEGITGQEKVIERLRPFLLEEGVDALERVVDAQLRKAVDATIEMTRMAQQNPDGKPGTKNVLRKRASRDLMDIDWNMDKISTQIESLMKSGAENSLWVNMVKVEQDSWKDLYAVDEQLRQSMSLAEDKDCYNAILKGLKRLRTLSNIFDGDNYEDIEVKRARLMKWAEGVLLKDKEIGERDIVSNAARFIRAGGYTQEIDEQIKMLKLALRFFAESIEEAIRRVAAENAIQLDPAQAINNPGGIDLNADQMKMGVVKEGNGVGVNVDPAMVEQIRRNGFEGFVPVIINVEPINDIRVVLGVG